MSVAIRRPGDVYPYHRRNFSRQVAAAASALAGLTGYSLYEASSAASTPKKRRRVQSKDNRRAVMVGSNGGGGGKYYPPNRRSYGNRRYKKRYKKGDYLKKKIFKMVRKMSNTSIMQRYRSNDFGVLDSNLNRYNRRWIPWSEAGNADYGVINFMDSTLPTLNNTGTRTWKNLAGTQSTARIESLKGSMLIVKMRNNSGVPVAVRVYNCYCKERTTNPPTVEFSEVCTTRVFDDQPTPGVLPDFDIPLINMESMKKYFKKWRIKTGGFIKLNPGESSTYILKTGGKKFSVQAFNNDNTRNYTPGWACGVVLETKGDLCYDASNPATAVSISNTRLNIYEERYINYHIVDSNYVPNVRIKNKDAVFAGLPTVVEQDVDDVTRDVTTG